MKRSFVFLLFLLLCLPSCDDNDSSGFFHSFFGKLDASFNKPEGFVLFDGPFSENDTGVETLIQSDGKIVVMGYSFDGVKNQVLLLRYNPDGTLDNLFGTNGTVYFDDGLDQKGLGLALAQNGAIIVTGYVRYNTKRDILVLKYEPDGTLDIFTTYSSPGEFTDIGFGAAAGPDGRIYIVGEILGANSQDLILLCLDNNLNLEPGFGNNGVVTYNGSGDDNDKGFAVAIQPDGKVVVAGADIVVGMIEEDLLVLRYNPNGVLDASFGNNGVFKYSHAGDNADYGNFIALQDDGKIVVTGSAHDGNSYKILLLRLEENGVLDNGFAKGGAAVYPDQPGVFEYAFGVAVSPHGEIFVAGVSDNGPKNQAIVLGYDCNGNLDMDFAENGVFTFTGLPNTDDQANGIAMQADGNIVVTGFSNNGVDNEVLTLRLMGQYNVNWTNDPFSLPQ
ncbi:delta-60 repeat domain-containing protein [Desulfatibacillum aliphaticivorans]|uniref:delta-60 repeat domain-containing protein n=1 Tax=Desulfatibacillum aliphaticivorans TaxID=218208 RepID=UPI0003FBD49C|nr:delta-60 repeat domain-containing protein [Desulfatibacillum aliphaticivorans]